LNNHDYLGTDISNSVDIAKIRFAENGYTGDFLQVNLMELPMPADSIDIIFSEGVLHHTDSVEASINFLTTKLKQGGRFMFYVYARKAPLREYTDDHIRHYLKTLDDEAAWEALKPLTKLGIALGELNTEIQVEEDIPYLGIKSGKFDLQRLFYWNICKLFYDPELSLDELNHINFDWFRPLNCHRHTAGEVVQFCSEAGLKIEHLDEQMSGITIVGRKA